MIILLVCEGATAPVASEPSGVRIVKFPGFVELPGPSHGSAARRDCGKCFDELDHWILPSRSPQRAETALASRANNLQQSWRFDWEPPKAVLRDVRTIDWILGRLRSSAQADPVAGRPVLGF